MLRELPFGARISHAFVKKLKWETAKASDEFPGMLPSLCVEERQRCAALDRSATQEKRIDLDKGLEITSPNRCIPAISHPRTLIREYAWVLRFNNREYSPEATFEIDGVALHISAEAQAALKGATILVERDNIVVTYKPV